jgi:tetratricopeptide (TPR) repeat protein
MAHSLKPSARVRLLLLICFAGAALPGSARAKGADSNALGFQAYEKGDYKKAHGLFEKAVKQNPSHAFARLNRARTTTLLNQGKEEAGDFDYCTRETNWIFKALADLSKAVELNPAAVLPKIDEDQKGLKALKARPEYQNWRKAVSILAKEEGAAEKVLKETSSWLYLAPGDIPVDVTLKPDKSVTAARGGDAEEAAGKWSSKGDQLEITPTKGKARPWKPIAERYYFNQGQDFFFELHLMPTGEDASASGWLEGPLKPGPLLGDCE